MRIPILWVLATLGFLLAFAPSPVHAVTATLDVNVGQPGHTVSPSLFGIFFEEINLAGDGGLYAELVRNRSFEDASTPDHWTYFQSGEADGKMALETISGSGNNRTALRVNACEMKGGRVGAYNTGYFGMGVKKGADYTARLIAKKDDEFQGPLTLRLENASGAVLAEAETGILTTDWSTLEVRLTAKESDAAARFSVSSQSPGTFWLDMVSVFPVNTFKNRANGLRPDLAEMLVGLQPHFVRFPGGCWVEGERMSTAYRWKTTIGPLQDRRTVYNLWQYQSTNGLGYHEYLQMCEDLNTDALFVINCGMSHQETVPMDQMAEYVQDALDAIEYANGPSTSTWGARRTANGHEAPFNLKYIQIGNENGGTAYNERYALFYDAIRAKYPEMRIVANDWGGPPTSRPIDILDEHYYNNPEFFIQNAGRYDRYPRTGPKIYVGEYAVTSGSGTGNLAGALGEAAFMTGMERNSDIVVMSSYAPLFANVHYKRWNPDLIYFDATRVYGTPSYYVQKLFMNNRGHVTLPVALQSPARSENLNGRIGLSTWNTQAEFKDIKVTQGDSTLFTWSGADGMAPWTSEGGTWSIVDGAIRQTAGTQDGRVTAGDPTWSDYTLTLKARKISGSEGFLILFRTRDANNWSWWNLGGWNNTRHNLQREVNGGQSEFPVSVPGSIETGRWYDIRIELEGVRIRCYLDNVLIHDTEVPGISSLYASAVENTASGEVILKIVNVTETDVDTAVRMLGAATILPEGSVEVLRSASLQDENSLDQPTKVAPTKQPLLSVSGSFTHVFPARSVSVLRIKASR